MLAERSTLTWNFYVATVLLRLTYQVWEKNDFGFNSFQKIIFFIFPHLIAFGSKFDIDVKFVKDNLGSSILSKLGKSHIPNKLSAFWFWRRSVLKGFYHILSYMGMTAIWLCDQISINFG